MPLPHALKRIRLELARSKEFPMGSANHGYEFVAPLDSKGHIDPHLWLGVHAFAPGEYVSIRSHEGGSHTFKVVSVEPAT